MNAFAKAVNEVNAMALDIGGTLSYHVTMATRERASKEEVIKGYFYVNTLVNSTRLAIEVIEKMLQLHAIGQLSYSTWWPIFRHNNQHNAVTNIPEGSTMLMLVKDLDNYSALERIEYFETKVLPVIDGLGSILSDLKAVLAIYKDTSAHLGQRRKALMR